MLRPATLALIRAYQLTLAKQIRSRRCRFTPSCSEYAYQAIDKYGFVTGVRLAHKRLSRCNPQEPGGEDLMP